MSSQDNMYVRDETLEEVIEWFRQFGKTDESYLSAHWNRYKRTLNFVMSDVSPNAKLDILDVGSHWLHNAFLYAARGHRLICSDAPDLMGNRAVLAAAEYMKIKLRPMRRMEMGDSMQDLPENSIDILLFCEIIEHMAFNPIPFWKQVYRVLRPGGRIIVTTPNSMYHRSITKRLMNVVTGVGFGPTIKEIMENGTYGHHWKEFSIGELREYFKLLSADFDLSRHEFVMHDFDVNAPLGALESNIAAVTDVRAHNIYLDVRLNEKSAGISINPPWIPL